jgi:hypothetical protein
MHSVEGDTSNAMPSVVLSGTNATVWTIYVSGHKCRFETPSLVLITDRDAGKTWLLNPTTHKYAVGPYGSASITGVQMGETTSSGLGELEVHTKVSDTGRSATIMGHLARHYVVKTYRKFRGTETKQASDILAAQDLSKADLDAWSAANITTFGSELKGVPLVTETRTVSGHLLGAMTRIIATSLSIDPIPSSMFTVPYDYTEAQGDTLFTPAPAQ